MNKADRQRIKAAVLRTLQEYGEPLSLPLPIKAVVKHFKNIRLIPYSTQMERRGLRYSEMLNLAGTEDAFTDYDAEWNLYIIYYNDCDQKKLSSNRYRWNIAHELGHVMLEHHKKHAESRIYRNHLSEQVYKVLEAEADMYAAYILVPHIVLNCLEIKEDYEIANLCQVSDTASLYRANNIKVWMKRKEITQYDFALLTLFSHYVESEHQNEVVHNWLTTHRACKFCHGALDTASYSFCPICGKNAKPNYVGRKNIMQYIGIDDNGRALECPVCHNTDLFTEGAYCIICGSNLQNLCVDFFDNPFDPSCSYKYPLPGNARYCPHCGGKTTFFTEGYLPSYDDQYVEADNLSEFPF